MLWTRLRLADPGAAIVVYLFSSAIAVRTTIQPLHRRSLTMRQRFQPCLVKCVAVAVQLIIPVQLEATAATTGGGRWRRTTRAGRRMWRKRNRTSSYPPLEMALLARRGRDCRPSSPRNAGRDVSSDSLIGQLFLLNQKRQPTSPAMTNP